MSPSKSGEFFAQQNPSDDLKAIKVEMYCKSFQESVSLSCKTEFKIDANLGVSLILRSTTGSCCLKIHRVLNTTSYCT